MYYCCQQVAASKRYEFLNRMALLPHEEILCKETMILASSRMMKMCILPTLMFQLCGVVLVSAQKVLLQIWLVIFNKRDFKNLWVGLIEFVANHLRWVFLPGFYVSQWLIIFISNRLKTWCLESAWGYIKWNDANRKPSRRVVLWSQKVYKHQLEATYRIHIQHKRGMI